MNLEKMESAELRNFLYNSRRKALEFWLEHVKFVCRSCSFATASQVKYVAKFMTRFSLVSTTSEIHLPTPTSMLQIYSNIEELFEDSGFTPQIMENLACQILFMSGFFRDYAAKHYNLKSLRMRGLEFFQEAAVGKHRSIMLQMSQNFGNWQTRLSYLEYHLRTERYILDKNDTLPLIKIVPD